MDSPQEQFDSSFHCAVVGRSITLKTERVLLEGDPGSAISTVMIGCSGAAACKLFPDLTMFRRHEKRGCPFHDTL
jgi:hypothetical protein